MSSEIRDGPDVDETSLEGVQVDWSRYIGLEDILSSYDTVIEIYDGEKFFNPSEEELNEHNANYQALSDESLVPGWDYDSRNDGVDFIQEQLSGNSIVVAFGFDGENLPNYAEMTDGLDPRGNWWDHPEYLSADLMVDDETYSGALRPPKNFESSPHVLRDGRRMRDVLHLQR